MSNLEFNEIDGRFYRDGELAGWSIFSTRII